MESTNGRSWFTGIAVAALFVVLSATSGCDAEAPTGVGPREAQAPQKAQVSATADSTGNAPDDKCYWVDGQWICWDY